MVDTQLKRTVSTSTVLLGTSAKIADLVRVPKGENSHKSQVVEMIQPAPSDTPYKDFR